MFPKALLTILLLIQGLIHLAGFAAAFGLLQRSTLAHHISQPEGIFWLMSAILFVVSAPVLWLRNKAWWAPASIAIFISQYLIIINWDEAKWGTIANLILLLAVAIGFASWNFYAKFLQQVRAGIEAYDPSGESILTEGDIQSLPAIVKKYVRYSGALGKPRVKHFRIDFSGRIRKNANSEWMPFTSIQYNFVDAATRLFFMRATMKGLPVAGFHCFANGKAFMDIRILSLIPVQYAAGKEMDTAETVTFFNDMCCMAPATLIDKRIQWLEDQDLKVKASFTSSNIRITAWLHFSEDGRLINFTSDDRYATGDDHTMKRLPWSTPLKDYKELGGHKLAGNADAVYSYPDGELIYGNFMLEGIEYNSREFSE